jgi:non-homologous end joining protein Ku
MAARATWKGYLKISLVNIPIKVFPATESSGSIAFNQLHGVCQTRIQQKKWCPRCEREAPNAEIVKGFEFEKGRYVVMSEDDLEQVRPESTRVIDLVQFADAASLDPMYVDLANYKDEYRGGLQRIIDAKIAGEEVVATSTEAPPKVVNLMDALRKSLDTVSARKKRPAKAAIAKAPAKRKRA